MSEDHAQEGIWGKFRIYYGVEGRYADVTRLSIRKGVIEVVEGKQFVRIHLPVSDGSRAACFGDPVPNVLKHMKVIDCDGTERVYDHLSAAEIVISKEKTDAFLLRYPDNWWRDELQTGSLSGTSVEVKRKWIHEHLHFLGGSLQDEGPEQEMAIEFLQPEDRVLELGSNVGRNTMIISALLRDSKNLVTLETDPNACRVLEQNRGLNGFSFEIVNAALSSRQLVQKGWVTVPVLTPEHLALLKNQLHVEVSTITWDALKSKLDFNVLVADCEGALYYIIQDFPTFLDGFHRLILENDYQDAAQKSQLDQVFASKGFKRVRCRGGGWGPCKDCFFEVWSR